METLPKLSPAQCLLLSTAARRVDGCVIPPGTLRVGARAKVLTALLERGWIEPSDGGHRWTNAGYAAIGQQRPAPQDGVAKRDTTDDLQLLEGITVRPGTKRAALVTALRHPQGAHPSRARIETGVGRQHRDAVGVARLMRVGRGLKRDVLGHVAGRAAVARLIRVERRLKQLRRRPVSAYRTLALEPWPRPHIDAHAMPQPDGAAAKHGGRSPHHFAKRGIERDHPQRGDVPACDEEEK